MLINREIVYISSLNVSHAHGIHSEYVAFINLGGHYISNCDPLIAAVGADPPYNSRIVAESKAAAQRHKCERIYSIEHLDGI